MTTRIATVALLGWLSLGSLGRAQGEAPPGDPAAAIRLDQRPGERVPREAAFRDESGATVRLGDFIDGRPIVLVPAYYRCPMLCTLVINTLVGASADCTLRPGVDYQIVVFSIDPREKPGLAAEKKLNYLRRFGNNDTQSGWHFLTGDEENIRRVTDALGYGYVYDKTHDQYAHPAAAAVLTGDGRIARYLLGVRYSGKDLRLALVEAGEGRIGSIVDQVLLRCYFYDATAGRYGFAVMRALRWGALFTVLGVVLLVRLVGRRRRAASPRETGA